MAYFTSVVKASLGAIAHLAQLYTQIGGAVTDSLTGAPLADASLYAVTGTLAYTAATNAAGSYTLNVAPAQYTVQAWKYGYTLETAPAAAVSKSGAQINLALTPTLPYSLTGCVTDALTGAPLSAILTVQGPLGGWRTQTQTAEATGCYAFTLYGGPYTLVAQAGQHNSSTLALNLTSAATQNFALKGFTYTTTFLPIAANRGNKP